MEPKKGKKFVGIVLTPFSMSQGKGKDPVNYIVDSKFTTDNERTFNKLINAKKIKDGNTGADSK